MHLSTSDEIPLVVKTIQLDCEELECVEEKGVAVASAGIGARAVSVRSHEHSSKSPFSSSIWWCFIRQAFPFWSLSRHAWLEHMIHGAIYFLKETFVAVVFVGLLLLVSWYVLWPYRYSRDTWAEKWGASLGFAKAECLLLHSVTAGLDYFIECSVPFWCSSLMCICGERLNLW